MTLPPHLLARVRSAAAPAAWDLTYSTGEPALRRVRPVFRVPFSLGKIIPSKATGPKYARYKRNGVRWIQDFTGFFGFISIDEAAFAGMAYRIQTMPYNIAQHLGGDGINGATATAITGPDGKTSAIEINLPQGGFSQVVGSGDQAPPNNINESAWKIGRSGHVTNRLEFNLNGNHGGDNWANCGQHPYWIQWWNHPSTYYQPGNPTYTTQYAPAYFRECEVAGDWDRFYAWPDVMNRPAWCDKWVLHNHWWNFEYGPIDGQDATVDTFKVRSKRPMATAYGWDSGSGLEVWGLPKIRMGPGMSVYQNNGLNAQIFDGFMTHGAPIGGPDHLRLADTGSSYTATSDSAALDITGDIDLRIQVSIDDLGVINKIAQHNDGSTGWTIILNAGGTPQFEWYETGPTLVQKAATAPLPYGDGEKFWLKITLDVDNGSSNYDLKFWHGTDGQNWTQLGSTVNGAATTDILQGSETLNLGKGPGADPMRGRIYGFEIRDGIEGTLAADFKPARDANEYSNIEPFNSSTTGEQWYFGAGAKVLGADSSAYHGAGGDCIAYSVYDWVLNPAARGESLDPLMANRGHLDPINQDSTINYEYADNYMFPPALYLRGKRTSDVPDGIPFVEQGFDEILHHSVPVKITRSHRKGRRVNGGTMDKPPFMTTRMNRSNFPTGNWCIETKCTHEYGYNLRASQCGAWLWVSDGSRKVIQIDQYFNYPYAFEFRMYYSTDGSDFVENRAENFSPYAPMDDYWKGYQRAPHYIVSRWPTAMYYRFIWNKDAGTFKMLASYDRVTWADLGYVTIPINQVLRWPGNWADPANDLLTDWNIQWERGEMHYMRMYDGLEFDDDKLLWDCDPVRDAPEGFDSVWYSKTTGERWNSIGTSNIVGDIVAPAGFLAEPEAKGCTPKYNQMPDTVNWVRTGISGIGNDSYKYNPHGWLDHGTSEDTSTGEHKFVNAGCSVESGKRYCVIGEFRYAGSAYSRNYQDRTERIELTDADFGATPTFVEFSWSEPEGVFTDGANWIERGIIRVSDYHYWVWFTVDCTNTNAASAITWRFARNGTISFTGQSGGAYPKFIGIFEAPYPIEVPCDVTVPRSSGAQTLKYFTKNNLPANDCSILIEFYPNHDVDIGTVALWGTYVDANNYTALLHDGQQFIARKRISGTNHDAVFQRGLDRWERYRVAVRFDSTAGIDLFVDGEVGTNDSTTTDAQVAGSFEIGSDGNGGQHPGAIVSDFQVFQNILTDQQLTKATGPIKSHRPEYSPGFIAEWTLNGGRGIGLDGTDTPYGGGSNFWPRGRVNGAVRYWMDTRKRYCVRQTVAGQQPILQLYEGEKYYWQPRHADHHMTSPAPSMTGNGVITIEIDYAPKLHNGLSAPEYLLAKHNGTTYDLRVSILANGTPQIEWWSTIGTQYTRSALTNAQIASFAPGERIQLRIIAEPDVGGAGTDYQARFWFKTSDRGDDEWIKLGGDNINAGAHQIRHTASSDWRIGSIDAGASPHEGRVYRARAWYDGLEQFDFYPDRDATDEDASWTSGGEQGETWTYSEDGAIVGQGGVVGSSKIVFDGSNDGLFSELKTWAQPFTVYMLVKKHEHSAGDCYFSGDGVSVTLQDSATAGQVDLYAGAVASGNSDLATGTWEAIAAVYDGTSSIYQVGSDGTPTTSIAPGAGALTEINFGMRGDVSSWKSMSMKGAVLFNAAHDAATIAKNLAYLESKL